MTATIVLNGIRPDGHSPFGLNPLRTKKAVTRLWVVGGRYRPVAAVARWRTVIQTRLRGARGFGAVQPAFLFKNASVFSLNATTFSYNGACEQSSKMYSSEDLMPFVSRSAKCLVTKS